MTDTEARQKIDDFSTLVTALQMPASYPHEVETISVIETHISYVFLTGRFAYKIKKPVVFDFLDFRSRDAREHYCDEEVRLNRRTTSDVYLGVVPITGTPLTPRVDGHGPILDYAVKMRQFPHGALLRELVEANEVTLNQIEALAERLSDFHDTLPSETPSPSESIKLQRNFAKLFRAFKKQDVRSWAVDIDKLQQQIADELETLRGPMTRRTHEGRVKEGHGDLHCENVVRLAGNLLPFDCLEFDRDLRVADVMCDLAFLVMDLIRLHQRPMANRVRNAYLAHSGDYDGLSVLGLYVAYRALVRAKVNLLRAGATDEFRRHIEVAKDAVIQRRTPRLIITCGLSGSGKSALSQMLGDSGFVHIRSDVERKRLCGLEARADSASDVGRGIYTPEMGARTYRHMRTLAQTSLNAGFDTIVDAAFLREAQRGPFLELAKQTGAHSAIMYVHAPQHELERRVTARKELGHDPSEADVFVLNSQLDGFEPPTQTPGAQLIAVDTGAVSVSQGHALVQRALHRADVG